MAKECCPSSNKLAEIECLRKKLVADIIQISGQSGICVEVSIDGNDLVAEIKQLGWHEAEFGDTKWYTSELPSNGSTTVYI